MSGDTVTDPLWNTTYLDALDQVVRRFTDRGIAVILHMSQSHWSPAFGNLQTKKGSLRVRGRRDARLVVRRRDQRDRGAALVLRRRGTPAGAVRRRLEDGRRALRLQRHGGGGRHDERAVHQEPAHARRAQPRSAVPDARTAIRSGHPKILLAFQDSQYSGGDSGLALTAPPAFPGVVYTFHYPDQGWADGGPQLQTYIDRANAWKVPLWVGEFEAPTGSCRARPTPRGGRICRG
jgi:hypothetical protein